MHRVLQIWHSIDPIYTNVGSIISALGVIYVAVALVRTTNFLTEAIQEPQESRLGQVGNWLRGMSHAIRLLYYAPSLLISLKGRRFLGARYYAELQILMPKSAKPLRGDYTAVEYGRRIADWLDDEAERLNTTQSLFREKLSEQPGMWSDIRQWIKQLAGYRKPEALRPLQPVKVEDFPELDDSRPKIKRYFDALHIRRDSFPEDLDRFLIDVEFDIGYLAPIFLITGLVNRFSDEDGWKLILDNYRQLVEKDDAYSEELRELRSFLFNCWLLWGPSIPLCSCPQWAAGTSGNGKAAGDDLMIQYGYGDENNSIDILVKGGLRDDFRDKLSARLNKQPIEHSGRPYAIAAAPFLARGRFRWGPSLLDGEVCPAQMFIRGGADATATQPINGRIVLECAHNNVEASNITEASRYYSAYLWVMFVIQDEQGRPFFDERWKNLLVFFEHGNIADATTYQTLKEQLVAKTCATLTKVLENTQVRTAGAGAPRELRIAYASAFDDANCVAPHAILFPPGKLGRKDSDSRVAFEAVGITDIMRREIDVLPAGHVLRTRLTMSSLAPAQMQYAACHLPEIVEEFYKALKPMVMAETLVRRSRPQLRQNPSA
jgi:hypothetical protein